jgi:hypothetical protein
MARPGGSAIGKTAFAVGGMGLTALAALAVGGPFAAATVAVAGRVLGQALGATGKDLLKTFVGKTNDYFFDTTGEGLIDGFRVEHPTLEDVYRRAFELSLLSLRPAEQEAGKRNGNDGHAAEYDWFGHWEFALKSGIPFTATGIRLPRDDGEADAAFRAAMEILAAQGAQRLSGGISITLKTEALPDDLFRVLKEEVPAKLDFFFNSLLVQDENTTAWKEHDLVFKREFLASFARLEGKVDRVDAKLSAVAGDIAEIKALVVVSRGVPDEQKMLGGVSSIRREDLLPIIAKEEGRRERLIEELRSLDLLIASLLTLVRPSEIGEKCDD